MAEQLQLDEIKVDQATYLVRNQVDMVRVSNYRDIIDLLPAVDAFDLPLGLTLVDGFHRYEAHLKDGRSTIKANVHQGTEVEALKFAYKANVSHGLGLTRYELKKARQEFFLLCYQENKNVQDKEVAIEFGCTAMTIGRDRKELIKKGVIDPPESEIRQHIKDSLYRDPTVSNRSMAESGGYPLTPIQRYRKEMEQSGEIKIETRRRGADGRLTQPQLVEETSDPQITNVTSGSFVPSQEGQPASADAAAETSEQPEVENLHNNPATSGEDSVQKTETTALATTEGDVVTIDGQVVTNMAEAEQAIRKIKHVGAEWAKLKSMILKMGMHADAFCQRFSADDIVDHLMNQDQDQAKLIRTRLVPVLDNTNQIITEFERRLKTYGQESFDLATADIISGELS